MVRGAYVLSLTFSDGYSFSISNSSTLVLSSPRPNAPCVASAIAIRRGRTIYAAFYVVWPLQWTTNSFSNHCNYWTLFSSPVIHHSRTWSCTSSPLYSFGAWTGVCKFTVSNLWCCKEACPARLLRQQEQWKPGAGCHSVFMK